MAEDKLTCKVPWNVPLGAENATPPLVKTAQAVKGRDPSVEVLPAVEVVPPVAPPPADRETPPDAPAVPVDTLPPPVLEPAPELLPALELEPPPDELPGLAVELVPPECADEAPPEDWADCPLPDFPQAARLARVRKANDDGRTVMRIGLSNRFGFFFGNAGVAHARTSRPANHSPLAYSRPPGPLSKTWHALVVTSVRRDGSWVNELKGERTEGATGVS